MRLYEFHNKSRLDEMNIANGETISKQIADALAHEVKQRGAPLNADLSKLFLKRALKAIQNDEAGHMVEAKPLEVLPPGSPAWMKTAMQRGETLFVVEPKQDFYQKLPHIVDWFLADPKAANALRAVPDANFMAGLYAAADKFYALNASRYRDMTPIEDEPGREVVLTFRSKGDEAPTMFEDKTLTPNEHGKVVMFWAKLTNDKALAREGSLMGHCVGGDNYVRAVKHDSATIFSLRDAQNKPHVTIEAQGSRGDWTINQVKGKGNKAPVAKYAPFVKAFLNEVGANASSGGNNDIRGIGLFSNNGRYGTPEEIGARVGTTFKNGDTLRILEETPENQRGHARGRRANDGQTVLSYMSKDGTHPLSITLRGDFENGHMINAKLTSVEFFRDDLSKYATISRNLCEYLNEANIACGDRDLEKVGVYFNAKTKVWGPLEEAAEKVWEGNGIAAYSLRIDEEGGPHYSRSTITSYETIFRNKDGHSLYTLRSTKQPGKGSWNPIAIDRTNASSGDSLPQVLVAFLNGVKASLPPKDEQKDMLRQMGVTTNRQGQWVTPDDLKPTYSDKKGSVRISGAFLYVLDKEGATILGVRTKNKTITAGFRRNYNYDRDFNWIDRSKAQVGMEILHGFSQANPDWTFENCSSREFIERGYVDRSGRLASVAELSKTHKIRGHNLQAEVTPAGTTYRLEINEHVLTIDTNGEKEITRVGYQNTTPVNVEPDEDTEADDIDVEEYRRRRYANQEREQRRKAGTPANETLLRPYIPLIMKATGIVCKRSQLLKFGLKEVNGKAVALDAKKDADLIGFFKGEIDLGNGLQWKRDYRQTPDAGYRRGTTRQNHHLPTIGGEISLKGSYTTLIAIEANDPQKSDDDSKYTPSFSYEDPSFKMRRNLTDIEGITRDQLYKVAINFLKFYHDKIMPMEQNDQEMVGA